MTEQSRPTLRQVIGRTVRELREEAGQRQEDVARTAREQGLTWSSSKVAALERGDKALPAEELVLLPLILYVSGCGDMRSLSDLVSGSDLVALNPRVSVPAEALRLMIDGRVGDVEVWSLDTPETREAAANRPGPADMMEAMRRTSAGWTALGVSGMSYAAMKRAKDDSALDAEQTASRRLKVPAQTVALAAHAAWGRGLTAERDTRVAERWSSDADARSAQAVRGHVTRELYRELRPALERWRAAVDADGEG